MKTKRVFVLLWCLLFIFAAVAVFAAGEQETDEKEFLIGYSQFWGTNPFLIAMTKGAEKAIGEWESKGYSIDMIVTNGGDTDASKQVADVEDLFAQGVDGLIIFPGDSIVLAEPVKNIYNKNNIPVVVTDIGLESGEWISYIITDNYLGGEMLAELVAKNVSSGAKVITFDNGPGNNNAQMRQAGFEDKANALGLNVLPEKVVKLSLEDGKKVMEDTMIAEPDLGAAFFINQVVAQGGVSAVESAGIESIEVVSFDIDATTLEMLKDGKILGLMVQDPFLMGYEGMNQMMNYLTGGPVQKQIDVPPKLCTIDNYKEFENDPQVVQ